MACATLTTKGQVTIPMAVREHLGLSTGDRIEFVLNESSGRYEVVPLSHTVTALKGIVPKPTAPVSLEDMQSAIRRQGSVKP